MDIWHLTRTVFFWPLSGHGEIPSRRRHPKADGTLSVQYSAALEHCHLYQAILNGEAHLTELDYLTTLAGFIHWKLTGKKVLGVGDASGMFPIDTATGNYNQTMVDQFDGLDVMKEYSWKLRDILPECLPQAKRPEH